MGVTTTQTNKPLNPRGNDQSPLAYNRAKLYSGKALDFDGVNDLVTTANNLPFTSGADLSIVSYFKIDDSNEGYFYQNSAIYLAVYRDGSTAVGELSGFVSGSWLDTGYIVNDSKWYQVAQIIDNGTQRIYLNGQEIATQSGVSYNPSSQTVLNIGKRDSNYLNGQMANVKAFNTALTAAQVADLYNNPEKVVPTGVDNTALKLWLPMQEGAGTTAYDGSGNGNHGTISGATYTHGIGAPVSQTAVIDWNKPYYFDGSNDYVDADYVGPTGTNPVSVSFWAIIEPSNTYEGLIECQGGSTGNELLILTNNTTNVTRVWCGGSATNGNADVKDGKLHHIAVTRSGTTLKIYVDGTLDVTGTAGSTFLGFNSGIRIGNNNSLQRNLNGLINEVAVYEGVLSANDVTLLYNNGVSISADNSELSLSPSFYVRNQGINTWEDLAGSNDGTPLGSKGTRLIPQGLNAGRDAFGFLFENVRKQGALNLDGLSFAEVHKNDSVPEGGEDRTLEVWVYYRPQTTFQSMMELGEKTTYKRFAILARNIAGSNYIYIAGQSYDTDTGVSFDSNAWNHIAVTLEGSSQKVYKNGLVINTASRSGYNTTLDTIEIGRNKENLLEYSYSSVAQPRIYNRALTAEEVLQNYNSGKSIYK